MVQFSLNNASISKAFFSEPATDLMNKVTNCTYTKHCIYTKHCNDDVFNNEEKQISVA